MAAAFKMIMRKSLPQEDGTTAAAEDASDKPATAETILAKYKKKARDLDE